MAEAKSNAEIDIREVSRDAQHSTYQPSTQEVDADAGPHTEQTLGEPKDTGTPVSKTPFAPTSRKK